MYDRFMCKPAHTVSPMQFFFILKMYVCMYVEEMAASGARFDAVCSLEVIIIAMNYLLV